MRTHRPPRCARPGYGTYRLLGLAGAMALVAALGCEAPAPTEPSDVGVQFAPGPSLAVNTMDCRTQTAAGATYGGNKSVQLTVSLPGGGPAVGTLVKVVHPMAGPLCWQTTSTDGVVRFDGLNKDTPFMLIVRDEVPFGAGGLEIIPPTPTLVSSLFDDPTLLGNRTAPQLIYGLACTTDDDLTWTDFQSARSNPCVMPGAGLTLTTTLWSATAIRTPTIYGPGGTPLANVVLAAITMAVPYGPGGTQDQSQIQTTCGQMPWLNQTDCTTSNGPALIQAMDVTGASGQPSNGLAVNGEPVVIEAVATGSGGTSYFGTITDAATFNQLVLAPGICRIEYVLDNTEPAGQADVDIIKTRHGVGMTLSPTKPPLLTPVNNTIVVELIVELNNDGGTGDFTLKYYSSGDASHMVRATFDTPNSTQACTADNFSGNGLGLVDGSLVSGQAYCATIPGQPSRRKVTFVISGLPSTAFTSSVAPAYSIKTDGDHLDPSRSDLQSASIPILNTNQSTCDPYTSNDGRVGSV